MHRVERDLWRNVFTALPRHPRQALFNARFLIAMRLGGFKSASR